MLDLIYTMVKKIELTAEAKYQLLLQIANTTRDTLDLDVILNQLLDQVQTVIEYDAAGIFVLNRDLVHPRFSRPRGVIAGVVRRGFDDRPLEEDAMLSLGKGLIGHVIQTSESLALPDVLLDPHYVVGRQRTRSEVAVPIMRNDRPIGALNLESDQLAAFDAGDVEILQFFAAAAALSIEKAMLHLQILDKEHLDVQMKTAHEVQARLLPAEPPRLANYEIAGKSLPAYEIGGDYYDFIPLDGDRCGFVVADVSGDGVPAALVMSAFRTLLRTHARQAANPAQLVKIINHLLPEFSGRGDFVTAVYGVLDPADGRFCYTNCGHHPPLLMRLCGRVEKLERRGPALGVFADGAYDTGEEILAPGDLLAFYTDGVVELANSQGEYFGLGRLEQVLCDARPLPAAGLIQAIIEATRSFTGADIYGDDFTLVILRRIAS